MKKKLFIAIIAFVLLFTASASAQTSGFVFQGKLNDGSLAANGTYQFTFTMYDAATGGNQVGQTIADLPATVTNGIFSVNLDFGANNFDGGARFLEISVRLNNSGQNYTMLSPRQQITSTPYAVKSLNADNANTAITANNSTNLGGIAANQYVQTTDSRMSDARDPLPNSPNYIQNSVNQQASSNFNISGEGKADTFNAATNYKIGGNRIFHLTGSFNTFAGFESGNSINGGTSNSFFGIFTGKNTTGGSNNSFFGSLAGRDNSTGGENSFFGQGAGMKNTLGAGNSLFGYGAGLNNTTGTNNTFVGFVAGQSNTTEDLNTFIGYRANGAPGITNATAVGANSVVTTSDTMVLGTNAVTVKVPGNLSVANTFSANALDSATVYKIGGTRIFHLTGNNNTFVGFETGNSLTTGTFNAVFGTQSGKSLTSGANNSFFGSLAGRDNTMGGENSFFGQAAGLSNTIGAGNSFFGYGAGVNNLSGGKNTFVGYLAGQSSTDENENTFIGYQSNGAAGITNSAAIGANSFVSTSNTMVLGTNLVTVFAPGSFNSATNYKIGGNRVFHITGTDNAFVGFESGNSITTGSFNAFFGKESGKSNTTGLNNAFFGAYAGRDNITGTNNAFFGTNAGLSNRANFNSFFGSAAGFANFNGTGNSFFGTQSGAKNDSGQNNSFFGRSAGSEVTTGSNNTFIGALSGVLDTNPGGSNNTALGYNNKFGAGVSNSILIGSGLQTTESNTVVIGKQSDKVFLGETHPFKLVTDTINANTGNFTGDIEATGEIHADEGFSGASVNTNFVNATAAGIGTATINKLKLGLSVPIGGSRILCADETDQNTVKRCSDQLQFVNNAQVTTALADSVKEQQTKIETLQEQIKQQKEQIEALKALICTQNPAAGVCVQIKDK